MTQRERDLRAMLQAIVDDARDEGRADMRDSVDEMHIERARRLLAATKPHPVEHLGGK